MSITVKFSAHKPGSSPPQQEQIGTITWDGKEYQCEPQELRSRLRIPLYDPDSEKEVTAQSNPEVWMDLLQYHFDSPYHLASAPIHEGEQHEI